MYLVQGTSSLVADIRDADEAAVYGTIRGSTTATVLSIRFLASDSPLCAQNSSTASTTWYDITPYTSAISGNTVALATTTVFTYNAGLATGGGIATTTNGFFMKVPLVPAQCLQVQLFDSMNATNQIQVWWGIATRRAGYNISN